MSSTTSPLTYSDQAAHEIVLEMIRAGKIANINDAAESFTFLLNHFASESERFSSRDSKAQ
ncbi:hypothetical protein CSU32_24735 [Salmonella enterica subsp. diarizonae]|nr:hypothetical protein [Salmonella enterica subsp. diarizonae]ECI3360043.1 hypothetical protein [Salmonella enterica subsp. diarizonae]